MDGSIGLVWFLCAWTLRMIVRVCDGFERAGPLVLCVQRVIKTPRESPLLALAGIGDQGRQHNVTHGLPEVVGLPGTDPQRVGPMRGVGSIDDKPRETGNGCMPYFRHDQGIGKAHHMLPLRLTQAQV